VLTEYLKYSSIRRRHSYFLW